MSRLPAVVALLVQLPAFGFAIGIAKLASFVSAFQLSTLGVAFIQGLLAALIGRRRMMAWWWIVINLCFPCAVVLAFMARLPPWSFLAGFLSMCALYWSTYRTQVPFYPSGPTVRRTVAGLLPDRPDARFIDIGSGIGDMVLYLARACPSGQFVGIEIAPLPWLISRARGWFRNSRGNFVLGDYDRLDFAGFDVVFAYLSPAAMEALWVKAVREMRPGSLLLSYEFRIPGVEPQIVLVPRKGGAQLYGWRF